MTTEPTRERVENWHRVASENAADERLTLDAALVQELCRAWLALHDAPSARVSLTMEGDATVSYLHGHDEGIADTMTGQNVKVVRWPVEVGRG